MDLLLVIPVLSSSCQSQNFKTADHAAVDALLDVGQGDLASVLVVEIVDLHHYDSLCFAEAEEVQ